jgi:hypothetical protein
VCLRVRGQDGVVRRVLLLLLLLLPQGGLLLLHRVQQLPA